MERRKSMAGDPYSRFLEMLRRSAFSPTSLTRASYLSVPAVQSFRTDIKQGGIDRRTLRLSALLHRHV